MNLSHDTIWEIIKHIRYEDIVNICQLNRLFLNVCRSQQAQTLFQSLQQKYKVDKFLNNLYTFHIDLNSLHNTITFSYWQEIGLNLIAQYPPNDQHILEIVIHKGSYDPQKNPIIDNFISEVNRQFLLQNYNLLPDFQTKLDQIKELDAKFAKALFEINRMQNYNLLPNF